MKITIEVPDEYVKEFLDELKMTQRMVDTDTKIKVDKKGSEK
jgi:hypothetical protein